jgi:hypothetical protein
MTLLNKESDIAAQLLSRSLMHRNFFSTRNKE